MGKLIEWLWHSRLINVRQYLWLQRAFRHTPPIFKNYTPNNKLKDSEAE